MANESSKSQIIDIAESSALLRYLGENHNVYADYSFSEKYSFEVSEIWEAHNGNFCRETVHHNVQDQFICNWLSSTEPQAQSHLNGLEKKCVIRVAWIIFRGKTGSFDLAESTFKTLFQSFGHDVALKCCQGSISEISWVTRSEDDDSKVFYSAKYPPSSMITWSRNTQSGVLSVIGLVSPDNARLMKNLFESDFIQRIAHLEVVPALIHAISRNIKWESYLKSFKDTVAEVEVRTGHHNFGSRLERPAIGDLFYLSSQMSGCATKIASGIRNLNLQEELCSFIAEQLEIKHATCAENEDPSVRELASILSVLGRRTRMLRSEFAYTEKRVQTQQNALMILNEGNNYVQNMEMASEFHLLALQSQKDSSTMKTVAVITMIFLPGTFVSSLFSIPLFDWESDSKGIFGASQVWKPRLGFYLGITVAILILTMLIWWVWLSVHQAKRIRELLNVRRQVERNIEKTEVEKLVAKRHFIDGGLRKGADNPS